MVNNDSIKVLDKEFVPFISEDKILAQVARVAEEINSDFEGKEPIFLAVLNGSFMFASDLMKNVTIPCEISFVKLASYEGTSSTGVVREMIGLGHSIEGRHVIIVEDIIESGVTMAHMLNTLKGHNPASISLCTFFLKPDCLQAKLDVRYVAMEIPNDFILGYGLDYNGFGRNLKEIYKLK